MLLWCRIYHSLGRSICNIFQDYCAEISCFEMKQQRIQEIQGEDKIIIIMMRIVVFNQSKNVIVVIVINVPVPTVVMVMYLYPFLTSLDQVLGVNILLKYLYLPQPLTRITRNSFSNFQQNYEDDCDSQNSQQNINSSLRIANNFNEDCYYYSTPQ